MLFFQVSTSFNFLFLFFYFSSIFLTKFLLSLCRKTAYANTRSTAYANTRSPSNFGFNGCDNGSDDKELQFFTDEDDGEIQFFSEEEGSEKEDLVADVIQGGEALLFLPSRSSQKDSLLVEEGECPESHKASDNASIEQVSDYYCTSESENDREDGPIRELELEDIGHSSMPKPEPVQPYHELLGAKDNIDTLKYHGKGVNEDTELSQDGSFLEPENTKNQAQEDEGEEILADSFTGGSISNSSRDWRCSTNFRDSETEDPFSSSSRRSSSNWETYTVFRKYDEEMMFLDRISTQKLTETESLKSVQINPRSISQRIVHKFNAKRREFPELLGRSPYQELEAAYVAQLCLTWEALNWNYKNFRQRKASVGEDESVCPGQIAQQFQQFQVLLQRFIENEPYEHCRRPEVYARMRIATPKLLQVPEFRESEADRGKEDNNTKISSAEFLIVLEDAIRTFMNFLKADKENYWQIFRTLLKKNQSSVDPTLLHLIKKTNRKKKKKLKDLLGRRKCFRKRILKEVEMEILMGLIDLEVVSRVLRISAISQEQLHWCEEKMSKVRVWEGKLQRDSSPLFFPSTLAHL
ncbi:uncharacterized protein LOC143884308 [Tasmannia lanceolata]|uniref:uncharacterized protein LOC143884308 n=1 Tax=Tasmannia lanceolata TaxID=3420 RepID=UPI0040636ABE